MSKYPRGNPKAKNRNTSWTKIYEYVRPGSRVLDIGCGDGALGESLIKKKRCQVYGIEIAKDDYKKASKVLNGAYNLNIETDKTPSSLAQMKFDSLILADVIEHFAYPVQTLLRLHKLLKPNGRLFFSIPNMTHISVRLQLLTGRFSYNETGLLDQTHMHFYNYDEVKKVFRESGWQIQRNDANSLPYPSSFLRQKLNQLKLKDVGFIEKIVNDINAQTFQFVGYCTAAIGKPIVPKALSTTTPEREFIDYLEDLKASHEEKRSLLRQVKTLNKQLASSHEEIELLQQRLDRILNSLPGRIGKKLISTNRRIRGK